MSECDATVKFTENLNRELSERNVRGPVKFAISQDLDAVISIVGNGPLTSFNLKDLQKYIDVWIESLEAEE